jgi:hypothetical protein
MFTFSKHLVLLRVINLICRLSLSIIVSNVSLQKNFFELVLKQSEKTSVPECLRVILDNICDGKNLCQYYTYQGTIDKAAFCHLDITSLVTGKNQIAPRWKSSSAT